MWDMTFLKSKVPCSRVMTELHLSACKIESNPSLNASKLQFNTWVLSYDFLNLRHNFGGSRSVD
jgi:hypothetical protein